MKLSEILYSYAVSTPQNKVTKQGAKDFLKTIKMNDIFLKFKDEVKNDSKQPF